MIGIFLPNMRNAHHLPQFLNEDVLINPKPWEGSSLRAIALWGHSWRSWPGRLFAWAYGLPTLRIEDGFIRSKGSPPHLQPHLSIIVDQKGIFYDASKETDLESLIRSSNLSEMQQIEAQNALNLIKKHKINKYNTSNIHPLWEPSLTKRVLVVDQTWGDDSIRKGGATQKTFMDMLHIALRENPGADFFLKPHPSALSGRRWGNIDFQTAEGLGYTILKDQCNTLSLLENIDHLYVVTSLLGFEALMLDKKVTCFGLPFYAGWGLTDDRQTCPRRTKSLTFLDVFHAAYIQYPRYIHPETGKQISLLDALAYITSGSEIRNEPEGASSRSEAGSKSAIKSRRKRRRA